MKFDWRFSFIFSLPIFTLWLTLILYVCFVSTTIDWPIFLITIAIFSICMTTYYFLFQRKYYQTHSEMNPQNRKFRHSIIIPTMGLMISLTAYLLSHIPLITIGVLSLAVFIQAGNSMAR